MRLAVSFLLGLLALLPVESRADTITVRADEWCPYNCAAKAKKPGYAIEIIKAIYEKAGHTIDYQVMGWTRSIERTRAGEFTAIIGAARDDAPDFVFPQKAIGLSGTAFAINSGDSLIYTGTAALEEKRLGIINSYSYDEDLDAYIKANKNNPSRIDAVSGDDALEKNFNKLIARRIDVLADDASVLLYKSDAMGLSDKVTFIHSPRSDPVYIAFAPKNPKAREYAELFEKGIDDLRATGKLKEILVRYGLKDWQ